MLTHGEKAAACAGTGLQANLGERVPLPQPFAARLTPTCDAERIDSLVAFLTSVGSVDPRWKGLVEESPRTAPSDPTPQRCDTPASCKPALTYRVWEGRGRSQLLLFDLGDHDLTTAEVVWAVRTARSQHMTFTATGTEDDVVGMGYENTADAAFVPYDHPDQKAVAAAMTTVDLGLPGPQWSRTYPSDPAKASDQKLSIPAVFAAVTAVAPAPGRSGHESECAPGRRLTGRLRLAGISRRLLVRRRSAGALVLFAVARFHEVVLTGATSSSVSWSTTAGFRRPPAA